MANNKKKQYDPYADIVGFNSSVNAYNTATAAGDKSAANRAQNEGTAYYLNLKNNGYGDVALNLAKSDYPAATKIQNEYATKNKVQLTPYLKQSVLKTKYGMSDKDIENLVNSANSSDGYSLGPINLGSPYSVVDNQSYWEPKVLDSSIEQYVQSAGLQPVSVSTPVSTIGTPSSSKNNNVKLADGTELSSIEDYNSYLFGKQIQDSEKLDTKYDELFDYAMSDPFKSSMGKSIMNEYRIKGAQESENEKASGAASNSGNVDSYAAANARRQQASLTAMGQQIVLNAQSQSINDVRGILGDITNKNAIEHNDFRSTISLMQGEDQRKFQNEYDMAALTGAVPNSWTTSLNPYFNEDGTLKDENLDYGIEIERIDEKLKTTDDPVERNRLLNERNYLYAAMQYKTNSGNYGGKYAMYSGKQFEGGGYAPISTLPATQTDYNTALGFGTNANERLGIEYSHDEASKALDLQSKDNAYSMVAAMAQSGITPPDELLKAAGYTNVTGSQFLDDYKNNIDKFTPADTKRSELYAAVMQGLPVTQEMLNAAGYGEFTPESFVEAYRSNAMALYGVNFSGAASSGYNGGSGSPSKGIVSSKFTGHEKLSKTDKQKIMSHISEDGDYGLIALLDTYDWSKYDAEDIYKYISDNYGDDEVVMAAADKYFGVPLSYSYMNKLNIKFGKDTISYKSGTYYVKDNYAKQDIIDYILNDSSLTTTQAYEILAAYEIPDDEIQKWLGEHPEDKALSEVSESVKDTGEKVSAK
jgi:hypothetical protein